MKILSIDPSSTKTGYAVFDDAKRGEKLIEAGNVHGKADARPLDRVEAMIQELYIILTEHEVNTILIEIPDGKVHGRLQGVNMGGLAIYGMAVGAVWWAMRGRWAGVKPISVNEWTNGVPKAERAATTQLRHPEQDLTKDSGHDAADAIGMADWWLANRAVNTARKAIKKMRKGE